MWFMEAAAPADRVRRVIFKSKEAAALLNSLESARIGGESYQGFHVWLSNCFEFACPVGTFLGSRTRSLKGPSKAQLQCSY